MRLPHGSRGLRTNSGSVAMLDVRTILRWSVQTIWNSVAVGHGASRNRRHTMWTSILGLTIISALSFTSMNASALEAEQNETGTYSCSCVGGTGACVTQHEPYGLTCSNSSSTNPCKGECDLVTQTTGAHPISPAQVPSKTGGPGSAPPASAPQQK
jgi:hypothetical protein